MTNEFKHIENQRIEAIRRIDSERHYAFSTPLAICFKLQIGVLKMSAVNDGSSLDIRFTKWEEIQNDPGLDYGEYFLHDICKEDLLSELVGEKIQNFKVAKYHQEIVRGGNWVSSNGVYAGVKIITDHHSLVYYNRNGAFCSIDLIDELPDHSLWKLE
ncbi:hypothetical protein [Lewinella sp. IMCC34191]|uniref:hypothetical protein n=1 Tax=Lewinella sp. IMCC34191 TaxID=2259172 RepID=UPI00130077A9|nr:hypothetical protein [Lewinella sp. IMCC34191]